MKNIVTFLRSLALFTLLFLNGNVWGQTATAVYTVTSTTAATQTGTKPSGAGHTYSQTFGTARQITSGNSATLTLTGYAGYKITSIVLEMRSNTSAGAGTLSVVAGSTTIASVSPTANFNTSSWYGAWSTAYVNVSKTPSTYNIGSGENVVIMIAATTNSLYIQSYTITYEPSGNTVTFDANGGTGTMSPQTASSATNLTANAYTRTGYTFAGWATTAGGAVAYADGASYPFSANATLYAKWTANNNTITFDGNGSTGGSTATQTLATAATATLNTNGYTRTGYTFDGWATSSGGAVVYADGASYTMGTANVTLYAHWTAAGSYTVIFDGNGSTGGSMSNQINNTATALTTNAFTRAGYTFSNWNTASNGSGTSYADGASYPFTANTTLYAQWTANNNTITFDGNGSTGGSTSNQTIATAATASLNSNGFTRAGFTFAGWATSAGGAVAYADGASYIMGTASLTLYAKWTANNYTITFDGNGSTGGSTSTQTIVSGSSASLNVNGYTKTGNIFDSWNTASDGSGTSYADGATYTMGTANVTLYAQWTVYIAPCFSENFSSITTGDNTTTSGSSTAWSGNSNFPTVSSAYQAGGAVRLGTGSSSGSITSTSLSSVSGNVIVSVDVKGWTTVEGDLSVTLNGSTQTQSYTATRTTSYDTKTFSFLGVPSNSTLIIATTAGRAFIDNVILTCSNAPEIDILGNNVSIPSGSPIPTTSNHTDFGSTAVVGGTIVRTFKIKNIGTDTLKLTGSTPFVSIGGTNASDFTLTTTPTSIILAGDSTSFQVTFDPSAVGLRNASISIANNDSDENPYTFNIQGTGVNSNLSDIIVDAGYAYTSNHDYTLYQASPITNTSASVGVLKFTIRDGGAAASDADTFGTALTSITFNVTNIANIRSAALFGGVSQSTMLNNTPTISTGSGTITFTGLSGTDVTAADNSTKDITLRVTYLTTVTDSQQLQYTISAVSADTAGSIFATANAGGATSSTTGNINRIRVQATKLRFVQQPTNTSISAAMSPSVTVEAVDANNNRDINYTGSISITSSGTLTGSPVSASAVLGLATFSSLTHTVAQTGRTLSATASPLTGATSNTFDITTIVYVNGDYRSTGSGTWLSNNASPAIWERLSGGIWSTSNSPSYNTSNNVYIQNGHTITTGGSFGTTVNLKIMDGGIFNCNHSSTAANMYIYGGGRLNINASFTMASGGNFEVEDNATVNLNFSYGTPSSSIWQGTEKFAPNSNLLITVWDFASDFLIPDNTSISTNTYNGYTACFGNVKIDAGSNTTTWAMLASGTTVNIAHGNLAFLSNAGNVNLATTGTVNTGIGGNFYVDNAYTGANVIQLKTSGTLTFNIKGNMQLDAATTRVHAGSAAGASTTLNIDGNLNITPSAALDFNSTVSANASATLNLKGNVTVAGSGLLQNTNSSNKGQFNFIGNTTQTIDIASTSANENRNIDFNVTNGAYVLLVNRDFELGANSGLYVLNGGVLDFGFDVTTPLNVAISGSQTGTIFQSAQGSTLKITSPDGIATSGNTNNVRTVASNRSFNQTATFHYIGKANQVTGNAITSGSTGKIVIAELADNTLSLTPSNDIAMSNGTTLSALGGRLEIRKGIVVVTPAATITGSGRLVMIDGVYRTSILSTTVPQLSNYTNYSLTGGTVELNGNGAQTISGAPAGGYFKVAITNAGTKSVSSGFNISKNLTITNGVFDPTSNSITGNAGLTMSGGTFRMSRLNETLPQLLGIDSLYNLTGGTVELYGSSSSQTHTLRGTYGSSGTTITYNNVELNATGANVGAGGANVVTGAGFNIRSGGVMNVNSPTCFQLASTFTIGGAGTFNVGAGATFKYGGTIAASGSSGNVQTTTRTFPTTASYGFVGSISPQDPGSGLPASMVNMYLDKATAGNLVTITKDEETTNSLTFYTGILKTDANTLYVSNTATTAIVGGATSGTDKYVQGRLKWKTNSGSSYTFPVGHSAQNAQGFTITPTGTNGSDLLGYLETNSTSPTKLVAYCDLETKTGPNQQIGQGAAGADGALDQITFNLASPLQWDVTNPSGGVTSYNITVLANGGQDINPVSSAGGTAIRYLMKNGEPGNTGFTTATGGSDFPTVGFIACPNQYSLSGMTSFSKFTLDGATAASSSLPVKLTSFSAKRVENETQLDWATAIEIDNDRFEVERSGDATLFEKIGTVKGNGTTTTPLSYKLMDEAPLQGWNYYRLKQIDFDGKFEYSNVIALFFDGENFSIVLYPNPTKGQFTIESYGEATIFDAAIFNTLGQEMRKVKTGAINDVSDLAKGNYYIKIKADNQIITKKLIVQ